MAFMIYSEIKNALLNKFDSTTFYKLREKASNKLASGLSHRFYIMKYKRYTNKFQAYIPLDAQIGNGIVFPHGISGIFVSNGSVIGDNCVIFHQVTVGSNTLPDSKGKGCPIIGNRVYIGAGAKIIGKVTIGDNVRIGANCVVTKDVPDNATVVMPQPLLLKRDAPVYNEFIPYGDFLKQE